MTPEQVAEVVARVQALTEETNTELITQLVEDAADYACAYTNRETVPAGLLRTIGNLAVIAYNRMGTEGESGRSEAGESYSFETAPESVFSILRKYRLARVGGNTYENEEEQG